MSSELHGSLGMSQRTLLTRKNIILIQILFFALSFVLLWMVFYKKPLVIDWASENLEMHCFNDSVDGGSSKIIQCIKKGTEIGVQTELGNQFSYPYAGFDLSFPNTQILDLSEYNYVEVDFMSKGLSHLLIYVNVEDDNVRDKKSRLATRRNYAELDASEIRKKVRIPMDDFVTPGWWYEQIDQNKNEFSTPDWSRTKSIALTTGVNTPINEPVSFYVYKLVFLKDNKKNIILLVAFNAFLAIALWTLFYQKRKSSIESKKIEIRYKAIDFDDTKKEDLTFLDYINNHFSDPELSLTKVSKECGVNQRVVSDYISETFDCNFKTYVNMVRINEAKRLLTLSKFNINEVAYKVGFNSPTSFNRVFKSLTNMNPSAFIKKSDNQ